MDLADDGTPRLFAVEEAADSKGRNRQGLTSEEALRAAINALDLDAPEDYVPVAFAGVVTFVDRVDGAVDCAVFHTQEVEFPYAETTTLAAAATLLMERAEQLLEMAQPRGRRTA